MGIARSDFWKDQGPLYYYHMELFLRILFFKLIQDNVLKYEGTHQCQLSLMFENNDGVASNFDIFSTKIISATN